MSDRYLPKLSASDYYSRSEEDEELADAVKALGDLIEESGCSDSFVLWVSTCRNAFMTINALFVDLRAAVGHGQLYSTISTALHLLRAFEHLEAVSEYLDDARLALNEFGRKRECWNKRHEYRKILDSLISQKKHREKQLIHRILFTPRATSANDQSWLHQYIQISEADPPRLHPYWSALDRAELTLKRVVDAARLLVAIAESVTSAMEIRASEETAPQLLTALDVQAVGAAWHAFEEFGRSSMGNDPLISFRQSGGHFEMRSADHLWEPLDSIDATDLRQVEERIKLIAAALYRDVEVLHSEIAELFKPNAAVAPLPPVFKVDLRDTTPTTNYPSDTVQASVREFGETRPATLSLAICDIPIPAAYYNLSTLKYKTDEYCNEVAGFARRAIIAAGEAKARLVIFPELFLPRSHADSVMELADEYGLVIIAGIEAEWADGYYSNFVDIRLPAARETVRQYKAHASNEEPKQLKTRGGQVIFKDTEIGTFSVVICSDFRESDVFHAIENSGALVDLLVVCSMTPYPEIYRHYAIADSHRLHSFVALANNDGVKHASDSADSGLGAFAPGRTIVDSNISSVEIDLEVACPSGSSAMIRLYQLEYERLFKDRDKPHGHEAPPHRRVRST